MRTPYFHNLLLIALVILLPFTTMTTSGSDISIDFVGVKQYNVFEYEVTHVCADETQFDTGDRYLKIEVLDATPDEDNQIQAEVTWYDDSVETQMVDLMDFGGSNIVYTDWDLWDAMILDVQDYTNDTYKVTKFENDFEFGVITERNVSSPEHTFYETTKMIYDKQKGVLDQSSYEMNCEFSNGLSSHYHFEIERTTAFHSDDKLPAPGILTTLLALGFIAIPIAWRRRN